MTEVTLLHGDCLDVMPTLAAGSVAMVFADLPYGVLTAHKRWDVKIDANALWANIDCLCKPDAAQVFTATQPFAAQLINAHPSKFKHDLIWHKRPTGAVNANRREMRAHEHVLIFGTPSTPYNPQMLVRDKPRIISAKNGSSRNYNEKNRATMQQRVLTHKHPTSVFYCAQDNSGHHPTQKPIKLLAYLIKTYTNPGDTVLDPVAGSGTTAIAAMHTGRNVICIEKDPNYFAVMQKRVADERARLEALND